jgi:twitching motility protein PilT
VPKIDGLLEELIKRGASDLHLGAGAPPLARIHGELVALREAPVAARDLEDVLLEILGAPQRARLQTELEVDFSHAHRGSARFRASYFRTSSGLAAAFRLVPVLVPTLADAACPEILSRLAERRGGLVLVTGPGRSGRSTTLAAMVDHVNKTRACHVLTVEDPTEFVHEPLRAQISHREVGVHAPSFEAALRSACRDAPDVVLVSALPSAEAAKLALGLASRGVLVLATLDTNGAVATLDRLVHRFPVDEQPQARGLLAESLAGVVSQQLLPAANGAGPVAVHEILVGSAAVSSAVREGKTEQLLEVMQTGRAVGMQTLDMGLERLLAEGRVTAEEALDRAVDREAFARIIARVQPDRADLLG